MDEQVKQKLLDYLAGIEKAVATHQHFATRYVEDIKHGAESYTKAGKGYIDYLFWRNKETKKL